MEHREYWGIDPVEYSALSFTATLAGGCTEEQLSLLKEHFASFRSPPWLLWPSWTHALLESASAAGWLEDAGTDSLENGRSRLQGHGSPGPARRVRNPCRAVLRSFGRMTHGRWTAPTATDGEAAVRSSSFATFLGSGPHRPSAGEHSS